ncbi:MAG: hypothetical protein CMB99_00940 [Flavobacteriaceae bacterium]|nr:hypothetical protein [Flavobacteriaceae bacterium]
MKSLEKNKENILAFLKESGQSKTLGISMMLGVAIKNSLMLAALRELEGEGLIKKDGLNRYTLISKPVSKSKPTEPNSPGLSEAAKAVKSAEKKKVHKTSEDTKVITKPEAPVSTAEERIKNTPAPEVAPVVKTPTTAAAEPRKARTLEDVLAKMENRLKAGPVADYENKVTVLTRMAAASEPEIQSILMEIAEDLREVDTRALRHA